MVLTLTHYRTGGQAPGALPRYITGGLTPFDIFQGFFALKTR